MNECACIYSDYGEGGDLYDHKQRKARKKHRCGECRRVIKAGETYTRESSVFDGAWGHQKTCADCWSIVRAFFCQWEWGYVRGRIIEHIEDTRGEIPSELISKLTPDARAFVINEIDKLFSILDEREVT